MNIYQWKEIREDFSDTLIVGNGGSIAVSPSFSYANLYLHGCEEGEISKRAQEIFEHFSKQHRDFERILYRLWQADFINQKLELAELECKKVRKAYTDVRRSLINTVKSLHPKPEEVIYSLESIGKFISDFRTVFSLNYDLILYWSQQKLIHNGYRKISDNFTVPISNQTKSFEKKAFDYELAQPNTNTTQIFYPHGNLSLYQTKSGRETKLLPKGSLSFSSLIEEITQLWADNDGQPLFVCEGSHQDKVSSISSSAYLSHVYQNELPKPKQSVVIYGWSMGTQDLHLVEKLKESGCSSIAVSVYQGGRTDDEINEELARIEELLQQKLNAREVIFFDASSPECWNK